MQSTKKILLGVHVFYEQLVYKKPGLKGQNFKRLKGFISPTLRNWSLANSINWIFTDITSMRIFSLKSKNQIMRPSEYLFVNPSQSFQSQSLMMMLVYQGMVKFKVLSAFIPLRIQKLLKNSQSLMPKNLRNLQP